MKKLNKFIPCLFLTLLLLISCSKSDELSEITNTVQNENFIKENEALDIARNIRYKIGINKDEKEKKGANLEKKSIERINSILDENGNTSIYVINYNYGGFLLLSADNRIKPILAFSENNSFPLEKEETDYPPKVKSFISNTVKKIKTIRNSKSLQTEKIKSSWKNENIQKVINRVNFSMRVDPDFNNCQEYLEIVEPLLSTEWHQRCGFNSLLPTINCDDLPCDKPYAGCVPIAVAQIMKYHNYPTNYDWSNMPDDYGTIATATLISDIHTAISNLSSPLFGGEPLQYGCSSTSVKLFCDMSEVLKNSFNYSQAKKADYNYNTVVNELKNQRPVILSGGKQAFLTYSGHMWVCDGYREHKICMYDDYGNNIGAVTYLFFNMNWGWLNAQFNGWYGLSDFTPGDASYNDKNKMIYNIIP